MKKWLHVAALLLITAGWQSPEANGQSVIRYEISFPNAIHNEAEITLSISNLDPGPVRFSMSRTSPGRYALHEFAKNVYGVAATSAGGDTLEISRPDLHNWIVSGHDGAIDFHYTLFADRADGTYSGINERHAHLNMPATFIWVQGYESRTIFIRFNVPENNQWKVATQLKPTSDPYQFTAPHLYYFLDSPTELSNFTLKQWEVASNNTSYTIRLAIHHNDPESAVDNYMNMAKKIVDEQIAMFGESPAYDFGTYTFIADYLPFVDGDGMEHRNSTILTGTRTLEDNALGNLYALSHEYFHAWNVERIRPATLELFNFLNANVSKALWFGEGFTSYYDDLFIRRAGLISNTEYARGWEGTLNYVYNSPGSRFFSPVQMSMQAPFVDAATSIDAQNKSNTFISYYSWGSVIGLGLDLTLRSEFKNLSLDDYMRAMWKQYGKPEIPYTLEDLEKTLAEITGNAQFAGEFFRRYIYGRELIDLKPLVAKAGFVLRTANPGSAAIDWGNNKISFENGKAGIVDNTLIASPFYKAGLDRGDVILSIDGKSLDNARDLQRILLSHKPGDIVPIAYKSLGSTYEKTITFIEDPTLELVTFESAGKELNKEIRVFRAKWLGSNVQ